MILVGVDEAGRGPLAGPVMTAATVLTPEQRQILCGMGLRDSKKLTPRKRSQLFDKMNELGVLWRAQAASWTRIDRINILEATMWAMRLAVEKIDIWYDGVVVDGNKEIPGLTHFQQAVIGGDDIYPEISAASVVAKVLRDRVMIAFDDIYPGYGFARHKGYGTIAHRQAITQLGPSPIHRRSFTWGNKDSGENSKNHN